MNFYFTLFLILLELTIHSSVVTAKCGDSGTSNDDTGDGDSGGGKNGKGKGCLHGDDLVITDRGSMKISDLVGHPEIKVLTKNDATGQMEFSSIYFWIHAVSDVKYEFVVLSLADGRKVYVTPLHLIYQSDCDGRGHVTADDIFAGNALVGKCLLINKSGRFVESKIVGKMTEEKIGLYSPVTANGNIIVNDILVSCFSNVENAPLQSIMYTYMYYARWFLNTVSMGSSHMADTFFSTQTENVVQIPEIVWSFLDLSSYFVSK